MHVFIRGPCILEESIKFLCAQIKLGEFNYSIRIRMVMRSHIESLAEVVRIFWTTMVAVACASNREIVTKTVCNLFKYGQDVESCRRNVSESDVMRCIVRRASND